MLTYLRMLVHREIFSYGRENLHGGENQMPNAKVLSEKKAIVESLTERLQNATAGLVID